MTEYMVFTALRHEDVDDFRNGDEDVILSNVAYDKETDTIILFTDDMSRIDHEYGLPPGLYYGIRHCYRNQYGEEDMFLYRAKVVVNNEDLSTVSMELLHDDDEVVSQEIEGDYFNIHSYNLLRNNSDPEYNPELAVHLEADNDIQAEYLDREASVDEINELEQAINVSPEELLTDEQQALINHIVNSSAAAYFASLFTY